MLDELYEQLKNRVLKDIERLSIILNDDETTMKRLSFCKNNLLNEESDASSRIAAICYIRELVDIYNVYNKVHLVLDNDLSMKSYVRR